MRTRIGAALRSLNDSIDIRISIPLDLWCPAILLAYGIAHDMFFAVLGAVLLAPYVVGLLVGRRPSSSGTR